jgi:hypothetical protein
MKRMNFLTAALGVAIVAAIALTGCDDILDELQKGLLAADTPAYGIALSEEEAYVFETAYTPLTLRVTNTGTEPTGVLTVEFIEDSKAFKLSKKTLPSLNVRKSSSFTVKVVAGLAAGDYDATVLVSGDNGIEATLDVSFTVEEPEEPVVEEPVAEEPETGEDTGRGEEPAKPNEGKPEEVTETEPVAEKPVAEKPEEETVTEEPETATEPETVTEEPVAEEPEAEETDAPSAPANGFSTVTEAITHLATQTGGTTATNPVPLKLNINLASATDGWYPLVVAIRDSGKYVALDISGSTVINGEFDSGIYGADVVQAKIVSLVLPDSATSISGGSQNLGSGVYACLKTVSGANITTIGNKAFYGCYSLTTASFPEATSIGVHAFYYCNSLTTISFPKVTSIGSYAFQYCTSLTTVSFPKVTSIGGYAFYGCTALTSVSFPEVTSIGGSSTFGGNGSGPLVITMGNAAPLVGSYMFHVVTSIKTVTVRVPSGATGYTSTWQNAFKGHGDGYTSAYGEVNENINLVFEYY